MRFLLFALMLLTSCTSEPKAFLSSSKIKAISMPSCQNALDDIIKKEKLPFVQTGITENHQAVYFIFADETRGILVHFVNPGFDWTRDRNFEKSKYKGYCKYEVDGEYFLVYEMRVPR